MSETPQVPRRARRRRQPNVLGGRAVRHEVKVSQEEGARLKALADARGVTVPRLLSESALAVESGQTMSERNELIAEVFHLQRAFGSVGVNVNQIAKKVNATGQVPAELDATMRAIRELLPRVAALSEMVAGR
jgi:hypothetical protein